MIHLKAATYTAIAAFLLTSCSTGCDQKAGTEETITQDEATEKVQEHIGRAMTDLPASAELEKRGGSYIASCDDPTDGGPKDRVTVSVSYWIRGLETEENDINVNLLHEYWTKNGYHVITDSRPDDAFISVRHEQDSFTMSVQESIQGSLSISASSPCVWPEGTPNP